MKELKRLMQRVERNEENLKAFKVKLNDVDSRLEKLEDACNAILLKLETL